MRERRKTDDEDGTGAGGSGGCDLRIVFNVGPDRVVVADADKEPIPGLRQRQNPQIQTGSEFEITAKGAKRESTMLVGMADGFLKAAHRRIYSGLLLAGQFLIAPFKARTLIDHAAGFQGLSLPALRSLRMVSKSRSAAFSTSSGVTPYSANGLGRP